MCVRWSVPKKSRVTILLLYEVCGTSGDDAGLEVFWLKASLFGNARKHLRADLVVVVECPCEALVAFTDELGVRAFADADVFDPADAMQRAEYFLSL